MADTILGSSGTTQVLTINSIEQSAIDYIGDTDWWKVTLTAGVQYQFDVLGAFADGILSGLTLQDPWLWLRYSNGIFVESDDDSGLGLNSRIVYTPTATGTYFLDIQESGVNASGSYKVIAQSNPISGLLTLGVGQSGNIDFNGDYDVYSITLDASVSYGVSVVGGTLVDPFIEIFATSYNEYDDDGGSGLASFLKVTPTSTKTHYITVRESGNNATGTYALNVWKLPTISIANRSFYESAGTATFTISLSEASPVDVSVFASTSATALATAGVDLTSNSQTVIIAAGETSATFSVTILEDQNFEPTETFDVLLSNPNGVIIGDSEAVGNIYDNDAPYALPGDSYLPFQWYLYPVIGVNALSVWPEYTGEGVSIAIFDQGIDPSHLELDGNINMALGVNALTLAVGGNPSIASDNHGTSVAGTIASERNGSGLIGVAYDSSLVSIYSPLILNGQFLTEVTNALTYAKNFDVLNNSWGFAAQGSSFNAYFGSWAFKDNFLDPDFSAAAQALEGLAKDGRNGLGTVVVQAAGNSDGLGDDTNLHNFQNSQFIVTVAATDSTGKPTNYSSPGASVLVAAPGGETTDNSIYEKIITTDRVGTNGYSPADYYEITGTSFSAPIVSGVVALMLEANPNLGYRDVQEILAYSSQITAEESNVWKYNGATNWNGGGLHYDSLQHDLGYGLVNAHAAVRLAETWGQAPHTYDNRKIVSITNNPNKAIPNNTGVSLFESTWVAQSIDIERVEVFLDIDHTFVGDLSILLTSPSLTTSFLLWRPQQNSLSSFGTSQNDIYFTFDTVLNWGEESQGLWAIGIKDGASGDTGVLNSWTLNIIGKEKSTDDVYIFTDEYSDALSDELNRNLLTDGAGIDTLNAAACTQDLTLSLDTSLASTIDGAIFNIATGTVIEKAIGGDGDDFLIGNATDNTLYGMRGDDVLIGGAGNDTFCFSAARNFGTDTVYDFSSGDRINLDGFQLTASSISLWDTSDLASGDVRYLKEGQKTQLVFGVDASVNEDVVVDLLGDIDISQLSLFAEGVLFDTEATGTMTVSGAAEKGGTLTASLGNLNDLDGATRTAYQWQISADGSTNWTNLAGATAATYAIAADQSQVGKYMRVVATTTDGLGGTTVFTGTASSQIVNVNDAPMGSVTISGAAKQSETLTASNTLEDVDGLGTISYQWKADGSVIAGASSDSYVLTRAEVGKKITVVASYKDGGGSLESVSSGETGPVLDNEPPTLAITSNVSAVKAGETATITFTFSEAPSGFAAEDITTTGGTLTNLQVSQSDAKVYTATFTPTANTASGSASITVASGAYTDAAGNNGGASTTPSISIDTLAPTLAITSNVSAVKAGETATITFTFSEAPTGFEAGDVAATGGSLGNLQVTADAKVYTATFTPADDSARNGVVSVTSGKFSDAAGNLNADGGDGNNSVMVKVNTLVNDSPTGSVTISGVTEVGHRLVALDTLDDADGRGAVSYQWQLDGVDISGATDASLLLTSTMAGKAVSVVASYADGNGTVESVSSVSTAAIAAPSANAGVKVAMKLSQAVVDEAHTLDPDDSSDFALADIVDAIIQVWSASEVFYDESDYWLNTGTQLISYYSDGSTKTRTYVKDNASATSGMATVSQYVFDKPEITASGIRPSIQLTAEGGLRYRYDEIAELMGAETGTLDSLQLKIFDPDGYFGGNSTTKLTGAVAFDLKTTGAISGTVNTLSAASARGTTTIEGVFNISGDISDIANDSASTTVTGSLTGMTETYADGSYFIARGGVGASPVTLGATDSLTDVFLDPANFAGDDVFNIDLPTTVYDLMEFFTGNGDDTITINGGSGKVHVDAGAGDDTITSLAGDHTLAGDAGDDTINGGAGTDVAVFAGARSLYTVTWSAADQAFTVTSTAEGTDTISGVETFRFTDRDYTAAELQVVTHTVTVGVTHWTEAAKPIAGVEITVAAGTPVTTDANGTATLPSPSVGEGSGNAMALAAGKAIPANSSTPNAITTTDALAVLKLAAGIDPDGVAGNDAYQLLAADADGDGRVTSYDAFLIMQYALASEETDFTAPRWQFVEAGDTVGLTVRSNSSKSSGFKSRPGNFPCAPVA